MLDRRGVQLVANLFVDGDALFAVVAKYADFDQLMGAKVNLISDSTASVKPSAPTSTTGLSACAWERNSARWSEETLRAGMESGRLD